MGGRCTQVGVTVHCLVQVPAEVANIARFEHSVLAEFTLKTEAPGMYLVRTKTLSRRAENGLALGAWIEGVVSYEGGHCDAHVRTRRITRHAERGRQTRGASAVQRLEEPVRRRG